MNPVSLIAVLVGILFVAEFANAYVGLGYTDTSDGFCRTEMYGNISVGDTYYFSDPCERVMCGDYRYDIVGCGVTPLTEGNCTVRNGKGVFPDCCPQVHCEDEN